jgi:hypothetical protein
MSRHKIPATRPTLEVYVGWDAPMGTFFAHVYDLTIKNEDENTVFWLGGNFGEITVAEKLKKPLEPFAALTDTHITLLRTDQAATLDQGPTPLQRLARSIGRLHEP